MHKKGKMSDYAKIFLVSSITLFVYGIGLQIYQNLKPIDPVKDVNVVDGDDNTVSITPSDGSKVISDDSNVQNNTYDTSTLEKLNDSLRKSIQKKYNVKILYGKETIA